MAITVDWPTKVINIPKADTLLIQAGPPEIRELDINQLRLDLRALEAAVTGMPFIETHTHNKPVTVGGVTLARVVEIINGYTITFEDGQYAVNLVGANSNVADVTNVNQVSVRSANSAGLTYSKEIEDQSFLDGRVFLDTINGLSGVQFPRGTQTSPVDNFADAVGVNDARGLSDRYLLRGSITLSSDDIDRHDWLGAALPNDSIALGGSTTASSTFRLIKLSGACSGAFTANDCVLENVSGFNGFLFGGAIAGTLTLAAGEAHLVNTHAAAAGTNTVTIDYDDKDVSGFIPGWEGGLVITNHSHANSETAIDMHAGSVTLDSTCTSGTIVVRGIGTLTDNSGVGCTVVSDGLMQVDGDLTAQIVESGLDVVETLRIMLAGLAGTASGATTAQMVFKSQDGLKNRITANHDGQGNRTAVVVDAS